MEIAIRSACEVLKKQHVSFEIADAFVWETVLLQLNSMNPDVIDAGIDWCLETMFLPYEDSLLRLGCSSIIISLSKKSVEISKKLFECVKESMLLNYNKCVIPSSKNMADNEELKVLPIITYRYFDMVATASDIKQIMDLIFEYLSFLVVGGPIEYVNNRLSVLPNSNTNKNADAGINAEVLVSDGSESNIANVETTCGNINKSLVFLGIITHVLQKHCIPFKNVNGNDAIATTNSNAIVDYSVSLESSGNLYQYLVQHGLQLYERCCSLLHYTPMSITNAEEEGRPSVIFSTQYDCKPYGRVGSNVFSNELTRTLVIRNVCSLLLSSFSRIGLSSLPKEDSLNVPKVIQVTWEVCQQTQSYDLSTTSMLLSILVKFLSDLEYFPEGGSDLVRYRTGHIASKKPSNVQGSKGKNKNKKKSDHSNNAAHNPTDNDIGNTTTANSRECVFLSLLIEKPGFFDLLCSMLLYNGEAKANPNSIGDFLADGTASTRSNAAHTAHQQVNVDYSNGGGISAIGMVVRKRGCYLLETCVSFVIQSKKQYTIIKDGYLQNRPWIQDFIDVYHQLDGCSSLHLIEQVHAYFNHIFHLIFVNESERATSCSTDITTAVTSTVEGSVSILPSIEFKWAKVLINCVLASKSVTIRKDIIRRILSFENTNTVDGTVTGSGLKFYPNLEVIHWICFDFLKYLDTPAYFGGVGHRVGLSDASTVYSDVEYAAHPGLLLPGFLKRIANSINLLEKNSNLQKEFQISLLKTICLIPSETHKEMCNKEDTSFNIIRGIGLTSVSAIKWVVKAFEIIPVPKVAFGYNPFYADAKGEETTKCDTYFGVNELLMIRRMMSDKLLAANEIVTQAVINGLLPWVLHRVQLPTGKCSSDGDVNNGMEVLKQLFYLLCSSQNKDRIGLDVLVRVLSKQFPGDGSTSDSVPYWSSWFYEKLRWIFESEVDVVDMRRVFQISANTALDVTLLGSAYGFYSLHCYQEKRVHRSLGDVVHDILRSSLSEVLHCVSDLHSSLWFLNGLLSSLFAMDAHFPNGLVEAYVKSYLFTNDAEVLGGSDIVAEKVSSELSSTITTILLHTVKYYSDQPIEEKTSQIVTSLKDMEVCCHVLCFVNALAEKFFSHSNACTAQLYTLIRACCDEVCQNAADNGIARVLSMRIMSEVCRMLCDTHQSCDHTSVLYPPLASFLSSLLVIQDISSSDYTKLKLDLARRNATPMGSYQSSKNANLNSIAMELELYVCDQYSKCNRSFMTDRWNSILFCSQLVGNAGITDNANKRTSLDIRLNYTLPDTESVTHTSNFSSSCIMTTNTLLAYFIDQLDMCVIDVLVPVLKCSIVLCQDNLKQCLEIQNLTERKGQADVVLERSLNSMKELLQQFLESAWRSAAHDSAQLNIACIGAFMECAFHPVVLKLMDFETVIKVYLDELIDIARSNRPYVMQCLILYLVNAWKIDCSLTIPFFEFYHKERVSCDATNNTSYMRQFLTYKEPVIDDHCTSNSLSVSTSDDAVCRTLVLSFLEASHEWSSGTDNVDSLVVVNQHVSNLIQQLLRMNMEEQYVHASMVGTERFGEKIRCWQALCVLSQNITADLLNSPVDMSQVWTPKNTPPIVCNSYVELLFMLLKQNCAHNIRVHMEIFVASVFMQHPTILLPHLHVALQEFNCLQQTLASYFIILGYMFVGKGDSASGTDSIHDNINPNGQGNPVPKKVLVNAVTPNVLLNAHPVPISVGHLPHDHIEPIVTSVIPWLACAGGLPRSIAQLVIFELIPLILDISSDNPAPLGESPHYGHLRSIHKYLSTNKEAVKLLAKQRSFFLDVPLAYKVTLKGLMTSVTPNETGERIPIHLLDILIQALKDGNAEGSYFMNDHKYSGPVPGSNGAEAASIGACPSDADDNSAPYLQTKRTPFDELQLSITESTLSRAKNNANRKKQDVIVVASLVDRIANIAGIARTCEIFAVELLTISSMLITHTEEFKGVSVTCEGWLPIKEVPPDDILAFIWKCRHKGYVIVGLEQTDTSIDLSNPEDTASLPEKCVLILGREKEGIPVHLLNELDVCIEIPQYGVIRSLNVHVSAAMALWEITKNNKKNLV